MENAKNGKSSREIYGVLTSNEDILGKARASLLSRSRSRVSVSASIVKNQRNAARERGAAGPGGKRRRHTLGSTAAVGKSTLDSTAAEAS